MLLLLGLLLSIDGRGWGGLLIVSLSPSINGTQSFGIKIDEDV